ASRLNLSLHDALPIWNLDMPPRARTASLQQSTRLALQSHEPRAGDVGVISAPALVVRVLIHAEWRGVPCRTVHGRRLALLAATPDRKSTRLNSSHQII